MAGAGGVFGVPNVQSADITVNGASGTAGAFIVGDTVVVTWNANNSPQNYAPPAANDIISVSVDFSDFGGGAATAASDDGVAPDAVNGDRIWTASYTIVAGAIDSAIARINITVINGDGTTGPVDNGADLVCDNQPPVVTDANISISGATGAGGAYKSGDTVTATWNNTAGGDNNSDISSATTDFTAFGGGAAVAMANAAESWSAGYALLDGIDSSSLNVDITATDDAGNSVTASDTSNADVDTTFPAAFTTGAVVTTGGTVTASYWNASNTGVDVTIPIANDTSLDGGTVQLQGFATGGAWENLGAAVAIGAGDINTNKDHSVTAAQLEALTNFGEGDTVQFRAIIVDVAGNSTTGSISATTLTVDQTVPGAHTAGAVVTTGGTVVATYWNSTNTGVDVTVPIANDATLNGGTVQLQGFATGGAWENLGAAVAIGAGDINTNKDHSVTAAQLEALTNFGEGDTVQFRAIIVDAAGNSTTGSISATTLTVDQTVPAGYSVSIQDGDGYLNDSEDNTVDFQFAGAEVGTTYNYSYSSSGGGGPVASSGIIATATDTIGPADLAALNDGTVTLSVTLTDPAGNAGGAVTDTSTLDAVAPAAFTTGAVVTTGGTVTASYWNASNTGVDVTIPIANDTSLDGGTVQLQGFATGGAWENLGAAVAIGAGDINTNKDHSVTAAQLEALTNFGEGDTVQFRAVITDVAGNATTGSASATTLTVDQTVPGAHTAGAVVTTGGTVVAAYWNSTNTGVDVTVPIANDATLNGGTVQLQGFATGGAWENLGAAVAIGAGDINTNKDHSVTAAQLEALTNFGEGDTVQFRAIIVDAAGNSTTGSISTTTLTVDQVLPTINPVHIESDNATDTATAKIQDTVTLTFTSSEALTALPVVTMTSLNRAATESSLGGNDYQADYQLLPADRTIAEAAVSFTIDFTDVAGNAGIQVSTVTDASTVIFYRELNWGGSVGGDWSTAGNWNEGYVPETADDVVIGSGYPVLSAISVGEDVVVATGAQLHTGTHNLTISSIDLQGTARLERSGGSTISATDVNSGTVRYTGGGAVQDYGAIDYFDLEFDAGAAFTVAGALTTADNLTVTNSAGVDFQNDVVSGAGLITVTSSNGTIRFRNALTLASLSIGSAAYAVQFDSGATITNAVNFQNTSGLSLTGTFNFNGGVTSASTTTLNGNIITTADNVSLAAVSLTGTGSIDTGATGGNISISGTVSGSGAARDFTVNAGAGSVTLGGVLTTNINNLDVSGTGAGITLPAVTAAGGFTLAAGGNILQSAALQVSGALSVTAGASNDITLTNGGNAFNTLTFTDSANVSISEPAAFSVGAGASTCTGALQLTAGTNLTVNGDITAAGAGSIGLTATSGNISINNNDSVDAGSGVLSMTAGGDIILTGNLVTTSAASPSVDISAGGEIVDDGDASGTDIAAAGELEIDAGSGIGSGAGGAADTAIEIAVASLDLGLSGAGNILIDETDAVIIIDVSASNGNVTINTGGAMTTAADNGTADVSGNTVNLTAAAGGIGTGAASLDVTAATAFNADTTADGADIYIDSIGNLPAGEVNAAAGNITVDSTAGITVAGAGFTATTLTAVSANTMILDTDVTGISASATPAGSVTINEADAVALTSVSTNNGSISISAGGAVTVGSINAGGAGSTVGITAAAGTISDSADDAVADLTAAGLITLTAPGAISGPGPGDSYLDFGAGASVDASVAGAGAMRLRGLGALTLTDVDVNNGLIDITAAGTLTVTDAAVTTDNDANDISLVTTAGDIDVVQITAGAGLNSDVVLNSAAAITDSSGVPTGITAEILTVDAAGAMTLDTDVADITAATSAAGAIIITEDDAVTLTSVVSNDGPVTVTTANAGNMTVTAVVSGDAVAGDLHDLTLTVAGGDLILGSVNADNEAILSADAGDITAAGAGLNITAVDLDLSAQTNIGDITTFATETDDPVEVNISGSLNNLSITGTGEIALQQAGALTISAGALILDSDGAASGIITATGNIDAGGGGADAISLSANDNLALNSGGVLTIQDSGLNVGGGDLRLTGTTDVRDFSGRILGTLTSDDLYFNSGSSGGATTIGTSVTTLTAHLITNASALTVNEANGITLTDVDTFNGNITVIAAAGDISVVDVDDLNGGNRVTLDSAAGAITDGGGGAPLIAASELQLLARTGIGAGDALETTVTNLAAENELTGNIEITNTGALNITTVNGTSGIVLSNDGTNNSDDIIIRALSPLSVLQQVLNYEDGNIILAGEGSAAADDVTVSNNVTVFDATGLIEIYAGDTVSQTAGTISANGGSVTINAGVDYSNGTPAAGSAAGNLTQASGTTINAGSNVVLNAPENISISEITAGGNVTVTANDTTYAADNNSGAVTDNLAGDAANISGSAATLSAATGIGSGDSIRTGLTGITVSNSTSGNVEIYENSAGTALSVTGASNVTGNIDIRTQDGNLSIAGAVSTTLGGTVTLEAGDSGGSNTDDLSINGTVTTASGQVTLTSASDDVTFAEGGDVTTTAGAIVVNAGAGGTGLITMSDGGADSTVLNAGSALIDINGAGNVTVGRLITTSAAADAVTITTTSGSVVDGGDTGGADVQAAGRLVVDAQNGIGSGNAIETSVGSLDLDNATVNNIQITETDAVTVVKAVQATTGNITITSSGGTITADSAGAPVNVISTLATGTVTLDADGAASDIIINDGISTAGGDVTLRADNDAIFAVEGDIATGNGNLIVEADADNAGGGSGALTMSDSGAADTVFNSGTGTIWLEADENITLGSLVNTNAGPAPCTLTSVQGGIVDGGDVNTDITLSGELAIVADDGIGHGNAIETDVNTINFTGTNSANDIWINETSALNIRDINRLGTGNVNIDAAGTITVLAGQNGITTAGHVDLASTAAVDIDQTVTATGGFASSGTTFDNTGGTITTTNNDLVINHSGAVTVGAALSSGTGTVDIDSTGSTVAINAAINISSGTVNIDSNSGTTVADAGNITGTGASAINFGAARNGTLTTAGNVTTAGGAVRFYRAVQLTDDVAVDSTNAGGSAAGADIQYDGAITRDGTARALTLRAGTAGDVVLTGAVGTGVAPLGAITVTSAVNFAGNTAAGADAGAINAASLTQSAGTGITRLGSVTLSGAMGLATTAAVDLNGAVTAPAGYSSTGTSFNNTDGPATITTSAGAGGITINHSGAVTVGAALASDTGAVDIDSTGSTIALSAVIGTGAGAVTIDSNSGTTITDAGDITTTGAGGTVGIGVALAGAITTGGEITTANQAVRIARAVTLTDHVAVSTGAGAGDVDFDDAATINDGAGGPWNLTLTAGTGAVTFGDAAGAGNGRIGGVAAIADLDITSGGNVTFYSNTTAIAAANVVIGSGTAVGNVDVNGAITTGGATGFSSRGTGFDNTGGTITTSAGAGGITINHSGAVTVGAALASDAGAVDIDSTGSTIALNAAINVSTGTVNIDSNSGTTVVVAGAITGTGASAVNFGAVRVGTLITAGDITTTGGAVRFYRAVELSGDVSIDSTNAGTAAAGANITYNDTLEGSFIHTINAGAGTLTFDGVVGGTGGANPDPLNHIRLLGAGSCTSVNAEMDLRYQDLYIDAPGANLVLLKDLRVQNLYFYRGNLQLEDGAAGHTLTATGNIAVFGGDLSGPVPSRYDPNDTERTTAGVGAWDDVAAGGSYVGTGANNGYFAYPNDGDLVYYPAGGTYEAVNPGIFATAPTATFSDLAPTAARSATIVAAGNFYNNGADMTGTAAWNLNVPATAGANPNPGALNNGTASFGTNYAVILNSIVQNVTVGGGVVNAGENVTLAGVNTNISGSRPTITAAYIVNDRFVRVEFSEALENSNGEIAKAMTDELLLYTNTGNPAVPGGGAGPVPGALTFDAVYANKTAPNGHELNKPLDESNHLVLLDAFDTTDRQILYFRITDETTAASRWKTDATGSGVGGALNNGAGGGTSTERSGDNTVINVPDLFFVKGAFFSANGSVLIGNSGFNGAARYANADDRACPVLYQINYGRAVHNETSTRFYDGHNYFHLYYSEPVDIGDQAAFSAATPTAENTRGNINFSAGEWGGDIRNNGGNVLVSGYFEYNDPAVTGPMIRGWRTGADSASGMYRTDSAAATAPFTNNNQELRIYLSGFSDGAAAADLYPGWHANVPDPAAANVIDVQANTLIKDLKNNQVDDTIDLTTFTAGPANAEFLASWDVDEPVFSSYTVNFGENPNEPTSYEIVSRALSPTQLINQLEFHVLDNSALDYSKASDANQNNPALDGVWDPQSLSAPLDAALTHPNTRANEGIRDTSFDYNGDGSANEFLAFTIEEVGQAPLINTFNTGLETAVGDTSLYNDIAPNEDDSYFSLTMQDNGHSWGLLSELYIAYDYTSAYITDLAGNLILSTTVPIAAIERTPPEINLSLCAVGMDRVYLTFSEPVWGDAAKSIDIDFNDFVITGNAPTGFTVLERSSEGSGVIDGVLEGYLTLTSPLTADQALSLLIQPFAADVVYDKAQNSMLSTHQHRITDVGIGVIEPVWASDNVHKDDIYGAGVTTLRDFTGEAGSKLMDGEITLETSILAPSYTGLPAQLYYDVDPPDSLTDNGFWLPSFVSINFPTPNTEARSENPSRSENAVRDFVISGADSEIVNGADLEFILKVGSLYAARITDENDPRTLAPWIIPIRDIVRQTAGVTILNNVINPEQGDKTLLAYTLEEAGMVVINVFNLGGDLVNVLHRGRQGAGDYVYSWDGKNRAGTNVARGVYFIRIVGPGVDEFRKVMIVK